MISITYADVAEMKKVINPAKRPADGYGDKIPTDWQARLAGENQWRKVSAICYSNVASFYVNKGDKRLYVRDSDFPH